MEYDGFRPSQIKDICEIANASKFLSNIDSYNDEMTISQVVRFFERQGLSFTKTMIQYYVRNNVIPPPRDKRYYSRIHLMMLYIIDGVKDVYSVDEMKRFFSIFIPIADGMDGSEVYSRFIELYEVAVSEWVRDVDRFINIVEQFTENFKESDVQDRLKNFAVIMMLMAQSAANKKAVRKLIEMKD